MEYLEGETLDDRLTRGPLPVPDVLRYGAQIADALDHAHRRHVVHRDVKPSNVMVTASGVKLLDFGLAKGPPLGAAVQSSTLSFHEQKLTAEGSLIGTFRYMAPEQLEGKPADERTDVFALGTVLYEMATGRRAFDSDNQASLIASILTREPPALSSACQTTDSDSVAALEHVVERCRPRTLTSDGRRHGTSGSNCSAKSKAGPPGTRLGQPAHCGRGKCWRGSWR